MERPSSRPPSTQRPSSVNLFGTREFLGADYVMRRAVGAAIGIYGNSKEEAYYTPYSDDAETGAGWELELRPVFFQRSSAAGLFFWSMTMYDLPGACSSKIRSNATRSAAGRRASRRTPTVRSIFIFKAVAGSGQGIQLAADAAKGTFLHGPAHVRPTRNACRRKLASTSTDRREIAPTARTALAVRVAYRVSAELTG